MAMMTLTICLSITADIEAFEAATQITGRS